MKELSKEEAKERIEKLRKIINKARYYYHVLDKSLYPDDVLDSLKHELWQLEQKFPEFITPDSPTQRIAGKPLDEFKKVRHKVLQWSLNDAFDEKEIKDFDERVKRELGVKEVEYTCELKIDGMHIILTYENGIFTLGATRGDGKVGEDVTQNLKTIEAIPLRLESPYDKESIIVEGEVFMRKSVFHQLNEKRKKEGLEPFSNPRNAASGAVRQLDPKVTAERKLDCFIYELSFPEEKIPPRQDEELQLLMKMGFKVNKHFKVCKNIDEVIEFWKKWEKEREKEDYWVDGVVVKVRERKYQKKLGYTGKAPRWAIAFKWPGEQATTVVEDVVWQVGRTGKLTPVAILRPVNLRGTIVTRATLHNADEIERLGIKIKDTVIVEKAGDVIPHVVKVLPELRPKDAKEIKVPERCPICGAKVIRPEGEVAHYCSNKQCGARQKRKLYFFAGKNGFDIEGLGPKIIDKLMDEGLVSDAPDLFLLKEGDLEPLERFAEKSAKNLVSAIQKRKEIPLERLLVACQIKYVGEETAKLLAKAFGKRVKTISDLIELFQKKVGLSALASLPDIGWKVAESIKKWFKDERNVKWLKRLEEVGVKIKKEEEKEVKKTLLGKVFVFTGELDSMTRSEAKNEVEKRGGKVSSSVSRNTTFLVVGKNPGSKLEKSKKLGVKTISEKEFLEMLK